MIVGVFVDIIRQAGIEHSVNAVVDKFDYVPVHEFRRIASRVGRYGKLTEFVDFLTRYGRKYHVETESRKYTVPERREFVSPQPQRQPHFISAVFSVFRKAFKIRPF